MKRRRLNNVIDITVGDDILEKSLLLELTKDDTRICSGLLDVISRAFVTALDHVREDYDKTRLELIDELTSVTALRQVMHTLCRGE